MSEHDLYNEATALVGRLNHAYEREGGAHGERAAHLERALDHAIERARRRYRALPPRPLWGYRRALPRQEVS